VLQPARSMTRIRITISIPVATATLASCPISLLIGSGDGRRPLAALAKFGMSASVYASESDTSGVATAPSLRATQIGLPRRVTPLHPPGNPEASASQRRDPVRSRAQRQCRSDTMSSSSPRRARISRAAVIGVHARLPQPRARSGGLVRLGAAAQSVKEPPGRDDRSRRWLSGKRFAAQAASSRPGPRATAGDRTASDLIGPRVPTTPERLPDNHRLKEPRRWDGSFGHRPVRVARPVTGLGGRGPRLRGAGDRLLRPRWFRRGSFSFWRVAGISRTARRNAPQSESTSRTAC
jgi:hypothetical protein